MEVARVANDEALSVSAEGAERRHAMIQKLSMLLASALVSAVVAAATAPAAGVPVSQAQFNALKTRLAHDEKLLHAVTTIMVGCLTTQAVPVSQYSGYAITFADGTTGTTSALDLTASGEVSGANFLGTSDDCASVFNSGQRTLSGVASLLRR
jgi:hypothetical protein